MVHHLLTNCTIEAKHTEDRSRDISIEDKLIGSARYANLDSADRLPDHLGI